MWLLELVWESCLPGRLWLTYTQVRLVSHWVLFHLEQINLHPDPEHHLLVAMLLGRNRGLLLSQFTRIKFPWNCCMYCMTQWEKLILISGCYENRFCDSRRKRGPEEKTQAKRGEQVIRTPRRPDSAQFQFLSFSKVCYSFLCNL